MIYATIWMNLKNMLRLKFKKSDSKGHSQYGAIYKKYSEQVKSIVVETG